MHTFSNNTHLHKISHSPFVHPEAPLLLSFTILSQVLLVNFIISFILCFCFLKGEQNSLLLSCCSMRFFLAFVLIKWNHNAHRILWVVLHVTRFSFVEIIYSRTFKGTAYPPVPRERTQTSLTLEWYPPKSHGSEINNYILERSTTENKEFVAVKNVWAKKFMFTNYFRFTQEPRHSSKMKDCNQALNTPTD